MALFLKEEKQRGGLPSSRSPWYVAYVYVSEGSFQIEKKNAFNFAHFLLDHKLTDVHDKKLAKYTLLCLNLGTVSCEIIHWDLEWTQGNFKCAHIIDA